MFDLEVPWTVTHVQWDSYVSVLTIDDSIYFVKVDLTHFAWVINVSYNAPWRVGYVLRLGQLSTNLNQLRLIIYLRVRTLMDFSLNQHKWRSYDFSKEPPDR